MEIMKLFHEFMNGVSLLAGGKTSSKKNGLGALYSVGTVSMPTKCVASLTERRALIKFAR